MEEKYTEGICIPEKKHFFGRKLKNPKLKTYDGSTHYINLLKKDVTPKTDEASC